MSATIDCVAVQSYLCGEGEDLAPFSTLTTITEQSLRQRFTIVFPQSSNLYTFLDVTKVCVCVCVRVRACVRACACACACTCSFVSVHL